VGKNDFLIISTAKVHRVELVSDEEKQLNLPQILSKRKIPAACIMNGVVFPALTFLDSSSKAERFLAKLGQIFLIKDTGLTPADESETTLTDYVRHLPFWA
jgi:hypothetical protein